MLRRTSFGRRPPPPDIAPVWTVAPTLTLARVGSPVTHAAGTVTGIPVPGVVYDYLIGEESKGTSYAPLAIDAGAEIRVRGIATNRVNSVEQFSTPLFVEMLPTWDVAPSVVAAQDGVPATKTDGTVSGFPVPSVSYVYLLDDISQGASFTPVIGDVGKTLKVRGTAVNSVGSVNSTSAGVVIAGAAAGVAPAYTTGFAGRPVVLGQPYVGGTATLLAGVLSAGSPAPTITYQWYRAEDMGTTGTVISGATASTYLCTNAEIMQELWVVETATNASGSASNTSKRIRVLPTSGMAAKTHSGHTADAGEINDPAVAAAYSATTLYKAGDVVTYSGSAYYARQPYVYGVTPGTDTYRWQIINATFYIDCSAGANGTGTSASPFNTIEEVRKRVNFGVSGYTAPQVGTLFLFKRGVAFEASFRIANNSISARNILLGAYGTGARPYITWAPPPSSVTSASGIYGPVIYLHGNPNSAPTGARVHNIDTTNAHRLILRTIVGGPVGTFAVNDVVTFSGGATGVLKYITTFNSRIYYTVQIDGRDMTVSPHGAPTETMTGPTGSATFDYQVSSSGIGIQSNGTGDIGITNCSTRYSDAGGIGATGSVSSSLSDSSTYPSDCFLINNLVEHAGLSLWNGAGGGAPSGFINGKAWFSTIRDCGTLNTTHNHQVYVGKQYNCSNLFLRLENTTGTKYGNHAFVYHGNASNVELAWNWLKNTKSGIGINDGGYGASSYEQMYDWHIHHNYLEGHTTISWELTSAVRARVHNNITVDSISGAIYGKRYTAGFLTTLSEAVFAHNTWYNAKCYMGLFNGGGMSAVTDVDIYNNIFSGTSAEIPYYKSFDLAAAQLEQDGNLYYRSDSGTVIRWDNNSSAVDYASAAALTAAVPAFEANGETGNPLFTNPATGDYTLQAGSPAKTSAVDMRRRLGYATDHAGNARSVTPSAGAYE